uniref:Uncharacterized protein n=1 Tax=Ditylenchus dipsaci TaxID=166011 RepID=A0A915CZN5_9BILA
MTNSMMTDWGDEDITISADTSFHKLIRPVTAEETQKVVSVKRSNVEGLKTSESTHEIRAQMVALAKIGDEEKEMSVEKICDIATTHPTSGLNTKETKEETRLIDTSFSQQPVGHLTSGRVVKEVNRDAVANPSAIKESTSSQAANQLQLQFVDNQEFALVHLAESNKEMVDLVFKEASETEVRVQQVEISQPEEESTEKCRRIMSQAMAQRSFSIEEARADEELDRDTKSDSGFRESIQKDISIAESKANFLEYGNEEAGMAISMEKIGRLSQMASGLQQGMRIGQSSKLQEYLKTRSYSLQQIAENITLAQISEEDLKVLLVKEIPEQLCLHLRLMAFSLAESQLDVLLTKALRIGQSASKTERLLKEALKSCLTKLVKQPGDEVTNLYSFYSMEEADLAGRKVWMRELSREKSVCDVEASRLEIASVATTLQDGQVEEEVFGNLGVRQEKNVVTRQFSIEEAGLQKELESKSDAGYRESIQRDVSMADSRASYKEFGNEEIGTAVAMHRLKSVEKKEMQTGIERLGKADALTELFSAQSASLKKLVQHLYMQKPNINELKAMFCAAIPEQISLKMSILAYSLAEVELNKVLEKSLPEPKNSVEKTARDTLKQFLAKHLKESGDQSTNFLLSMQPQSNSKESILLKQKAVLHQVESNLNAAQTESAKLEASIEGNSADIFAQAVSKESFKAASLAKSFSIEMSECSDAMVSSIPSNEENSLTAKQVLKEEAKADFQQYETEQSTTDVILQQIPQTQSQLSEKAAVVEQSNALRALFCAHSASFEELIQQISMQNPSVSELKAMFCAAIPEQISLQMFTLACTLAEIELNKVLEKSMPESKSLVEKTAKDTLKEFMAKHLKEAGEHSTNLLLSMQPLMPSSGIIWLKEKSDVSKVESNLNAAQTESAKLETSLEGRKTEETSQSITKQSTKLAPLAKTFAIEKNECSDAMVSSIPSNEEYSLTANQVLKEEAKADFQHYGTEQYTTDVALQHIEARQVQNKDQISIIKQINTLTALLNTHSASLKELVQQIYMQKPNVSELKAMFCTAIPEQVILKMSVLASSLAEVDLKTALYKGLAEPKSPVEKTATDVLKEFLTKHLKEAGDRSTNLLLSMQPLFPSEEGIVLKEKAVISKVESNLNAAQNEASSMQIDMKNMPRETSTQAISKETSKSAPLSKNLSIERSECADASMASTSNSEQCAFSSKEATKEKTSGDFREYTIIDSLTDVRVQRMKPSQDQAGAYQKNISEQTNALTALLNAHSWSLKKCIQQISMQKPNQEELRAMFCASIPQQISLQMSMFACSLTKIELSKVIENNLPSMTNFAEKTARDTLKEFMAKHLKEAGNHTTNLLLSMQPQGPSEEGIVFTEKEEATKVATNLKAAQSVLALVQTSLESKPTEASVQKTTTGGTRTEPLHKSLLIEKGVCPDVLIPSTQSEEEFSSGAKSLTKEETHGGFREYGTEELFTDVAMQRNGQFGSQFADQTYIVDQANELTELFEAKSVSLKELVQQISMQKLAEKELKAMFCAAIPEQISLKMSILAYSLAEVELNKVLEKSLPEPKNSVEKTARDTLKQFLAKHLKESGDQSTNFLLSMQPQSNSKESILLKQKAVLHQVESNLNAAQTESAKLEASIEGNSADIFAQAVSKESFKAASLAKSFSIEMSECSDAMVSSIPSNEENSLTAKQVLKEEAKADFQQYETEQSTTDVILQQIPQTQSQLSEKAAVVEQSNALRALFCAHSASFEELIQQISMQNPSVSELKAMFCAAIPEQISLQMFTLACTLAEIELNKVLEKSMPESKSLVEKTAKDTLKEFMAKHLKEAGEHSTNLLLSMQPQFFQKKVLY